MLSTRPGGTYNLKLHLLCSHQRLAFLLDRLQKLRQRPRQSRLEAGAIAQPMFKFGGGSFPSGTAYLDSVVLNLDGQTTPSTLLLPGRSSPALQSATSLTTPAAPASGAINCDYLTSDHNLINQQRLSLRLDQRNLLQQRPMVPITYSGFHNTHLQQHRGPGEFDGSSNHTDGNGIILDLGGNTPPALIIKQCCLWQRRPLHSIREPRQFSGL